MITLDFTSLVRNQVTAIQALCAKALDFSLGSVLRAMVESNSSVVLWLEGLLIQLLAITRASTCFGSDLDSWMTDYSMIREAATPGVGSVTFSRFTTGQLAAIQIGYQVESRFDSQAFAVTRDTTNSYYDTFSDSYLLPSDVLSITVPVQGMTPGAASNVVADSLTVLTQSVVGIDTVNNALSLNGGSDAESDSAFRARFVLYILSLSKATKSAISYAIVSLQPGIKYVLIENMNYAGQTQVGNFVAIIDDGTGYPSDALLAQAYNAIDAVRGFTITFNTHAPVVEIATILMTLPGANDATKLLVKNALIDAVNALDLGDTFVFQLISTMTYNICGIFPTEVSLNGSNGNLFVTATQVVRTNTSSVTVI